MLLSHSNRKDDASTSSNIGIPVRRESLENETNSLELDQGNTAPMKMVVSKKKIVYLLSCGLLMICLLFIIIGSAVFIFCTKGSGNKTSLLHIHLARISYKSYAQQFFYLESKLPLFIIRHAE